MTAQDFTIWFLTVNDTPVGLQVAHDLWVVDLFTTQVWD